MIPWPLISSLIFSALPRVGADSDKSWATIPMNGVQPYLSEYTKTPITAPVLIGMLPQQINLTVDISSGLLATYGYDCILCAGSTLFDTSLSQTFETNNTPWADSIPSFSGVEVSDTVGFGVLSVQNQPFVYILDGSNTNFSNPIWNGHFGLFLNPLNITAIARHIFTQLYQSSSLLNPVVGMRFDPANPKLTIGALDPNDYEGTINWVELNQTPGANDDYFNTFPLDGVKGYDGQFVPFSGSLTAALDSFFLSIAVPNADLYFLNSNATGPVPKPSPVNGTDLIEWNCTDSATSSGAFGPPESPYVALTATINGIDYQIDSVGNLLRPQGGLTSAGACPVGIKNRTGTAQPSVVLGLPFLRSVYVAYRFPTDDCPGYYGFAFPAGSNRTQSQISQKPTATPTNSAQCLALTAPTSMPTADILLAQEVFAYESLYAVYKGQGVQVPLVGIDDLPKAVWNWTG